MWVATTVFDVWDEVVAHCGLGEVVVVGVGVGVRKCAWEGKCVGVKKFM